MSRAWGLRLMIGGFAAALVLWRMQRAQWVQFAPAWHSLIRDGYATLAALLVALAGLYLFLKPEE